MRTPSELANAQSLAVIGGTNSGKTHFGGQFLQRLNEKKGELQMRGAARNIGLFEGVLRSLQSGVAAGHTPSEFHGDAVFPVIGSNTPPTDLVWPEYGGEQIKKLLEERRISVTWHDRVAQSAGWLLFIRVQDVHPPEDILTRPILELLAPHTEGGVPSSTGSKFKWSQQASLIELLQLLLFTRGVGTLMPVASPPLVVLLSCWDEISGKDGKAPVRLLADRLPMLSAFVSSIWHPTKIQIFGLSSLGRPLDRDKPDPDYLENGPECFGEVVQPDGNVSSDLTLPVAVLARMANSNR